MDSQQPKGDCLIPYDPLDNFFPPPEDDDDSQKEAEEKKKKERFPPSVWEAPPPQSGPLTAETMEKFVKELEARILGPSKTNPIESYGGLSQFSLNDPFMHADPRDMGWEWIDDDLRSIDIYRADREARMDLGFPPYNQRMIEGSPDEVRKRVSLVYYAVTGKQDKFDLGTTPFKGQSEEIVRYVLAQYGLGLSFPLSDVRQSRRTAESSVFYVPPRVSDCRVVTPLKPIVILYWGRDEFKKATEYIKMHMEFRLEDSAVYVTGPLGNLAGLIQQATSRQEGNSFYLLCLGDIPFDKEGVELVKRLGEIRFTVPSPELCIAAEDWSARQERRQQLRDKYKHIGLKDTGEARRKERAYYPPKPWLTAEDERYGYD